MIIYIDMDDVLCDYSSAHRKALEENPLVSFPQSQYGFYQKLLPLEGAIETVMALYNSAEYTPYILTAPSTRNPFSYTEKRVWIEEKFGYDFVERLIICSHKGLLKGDVLIDDNHSGRGQEHFEGRLIHFGSPQFPDWASVSNKLNIKC
jgi:5'(3')-deoxyribonucleotidase